ncbi:hypothetical protein BD626DRAFT_480882 [Schizophyllum amplum]|uniref:Long chronological lifespan protein 2 n=1 Tax=Schizophyllum amplum TaxID=97359 RepID=A0A550CTL7_9AGAR|nr:hypothetical protein BD626DRAFT_480882 [Auriculariopsis ampla]
MLNFSPLASICLWAATMVSAQFGFFEQMFGGQQQQQQQQHSHASQWAAYQESVPCSKYLCPGTLECVARPTDCPCPDVQDIKCLIPDKADGATMVCVRGEEGCAGVEKLARAKVMQV